MPRRHGRGIEEWAVSVFGKAQSGRYGRPWVLGAPLLAGVLALGACTSANSPGAESTVTRTRMPSPSAVTSTSQAPAPQATIATDLKHSTGVNPTAPISLSVKGGAIKSVTMLNSEGKKVTGQLSTDGSSWRTTEVLGYSKTYNITATAANGDGVITTKKLSFTTLTPSNMTLPYFDTVYGSPLQNNGTYGVGMIPVVHFDEVIPDRAAAERALHVTTSPSVAGSWYWTDGQTLHWRPQNFYAPGTKVTIAAKVYGVDVGGGMYGQEDRSISFTIGRKQITEAYDTGLSAGESGTPHVDKVNVYRNGTLVRTMNTSMGKHGGETVDGKYINFYTLTGTYTVLGFENPAHMCSDTYGLPANAPGGYGCEDIPWSTKISTDGIYLHELDATVWDQDNGYDVSHGCLNLNHDNAEWYFTHSIVGDPVIIHGAKGAPTLQLWQGGDWTMSWSQWLKGSALH